jgi:ABC-type phosphate transport system substrate-binding protein
MKKRNVQWLLAVAAGWACWSMNCSEPAHAQDSEPLVMVVNKANTSSSHVDLGEAKKLLLGEESTWHSGAKVLVVLTPPGSSQRATVLKKVCGMSEAVYTRYEMQASFSGQTAASINVAASDAAVKSTVKANPGAVGFVHKSQADETVLVAMVLD